MRLRNIPIAKETIQNSKFVIQNPKETIGAWRDIFENENLIHIEVGMGKGKFIMQMAELHPDINYIGIEKYDSVLLRAIQKCEELKEDNKIFTNLRFLCIDARELPEIFAKGEVDKIYLNFSDPWPKERHAKRRLTSHQFLACYDKILAEDGTVEFKTDNRTLFDFSLEEVPQAEGRWEILASTYDLHHDEVLNKGNVMTEYEEKFSSMGNPIHKMIIRR